MAKKKYYAVAKGKSDIPMILESWASCQKEVIGVKGAIYKSFESLDEAKNFIKLQNGEKIVSKSDLTEKNIVNFENGLKIYVDGSFMQHKGNFSYGLVAVKDNQVIYKDYGIGTDRDAVALRNVSGEVLGAMKAIEYALNQNYKEVTICYDYQGIECWALGTWKRNKDLTKQYNLYMQEKMKEINVKFMKIKGHSGDKFNDMADVLAKKALTEQ